MPSIVPQTYDSLKESGFADIPGYEHRYLINPDGVVVSLLQKTPRMLKFRCVEGYPAVWLQNPRKLLRVHRIVGLVFLPRVAGRDCLNHIDGDKANFALSNLEWCTPSENMVHAYALGLKKPTSGVTNGRAKLSEKDVMEIRGLHREEGLDCLNICFRFRIHPTTVSDILKGKNWRCLPLEEK